MTTNEYEGTDVQSIALHDDGFAWEAIVRVRGVAYVARYVAGRLSIETSPGVGAWRARIWHADVVREWSMAKVVRLSRSWHRRHEAMHGIRRERNAIRRAVRARLEAIESGACA